MTVPRLSRTARASAPWAGSSRTGGTYGKPEAPKKWHGHAAEAIARRTPAQREAALAERLAELRADPPIGYPTRTATHPATRTA